MRVLVANRSEIAIRIFRACTELGYRSIGMYSFEDRYSLHRYKADESYQIGSDGESIKPYLDIDAIISLATEVEADMIHPGYGFLSENAEFARACHLADIRFVGPDADMIDALGNKIAAKEKAEIAGVPTIQGATVTNLEAAITAARSIGYPVILKAASGGGGRGMRVIHQESDLTDGFDSARREAANAFGDDRVFLEKYIANPKHIEVQILGDTHGNRVHLYERDCSVQRRFQKVIECAPSVTLTDSTREKLYEYALKIADAVHYVNAGTVEFLVDGQDIYFIEVNPRIQVEHTVTEMVTGIDLVRAQLLTAGGFAIDGPEIHIGSQADIRCHGFAIQCRITTEDPENEFRPDYGQIIAYRNAAGFGLRLDEGSVFNGAVISPFFDSMLVKVSSWAMTLPDAADRMYRSLLEFRIRGVKTNIPFLENVMKHPGFRSGEATVHYIHQHPELFSFRYRKDRGTRLLKYIAEVTINGNPDVKQINPLVKFRQIKPFESVSSDVPEGMKQRFDSLGREGFVDWLYAEKAVHITDTTFRDAHQSLIATRVRTLDMLPAATRYAYDFPDMFSVEMWGGATFDVAYRFLHEPPWDRLQKLRQRMPNQLFQMLLRGSNAVGYTAYPDNLIERFIIEAAAEGIDIFRIFDSLNWVEGMRLSIQTVAEKTDKIAEACLCYTGHVLNTTYQKYNLDYYLNLAGELVDAGAHILAIKDMAGLLKPYAAEVLIAELKAKTGLPVHLHTHDTSSIQSATYLKAIEAGVDVIDCAVGAMSGLTSQPNMNAILEVLKDSPRKSSIDIEAMNRHSEYWESVRDRYYPFESGLKSGAADVYHHEIPGGQYSNLQPQAASLGLADRMDEIKSMYHDVNQLFGDIVKVTPSSKVVGDLALYLVSNGLTVEDIARQGDEFPFPDSVVGFFMGNLGQPAGGFPEDIQKQVLKGREPFIDRPGKHLDPIDFDAEFTLFQQQFGDHLGILDFLAYKLYPKVFQEYYDFRSLYSDVSVLPSDVFFYGMTKDQEILAEIGVGKTLFIKLISVSRPDADGIRQVFFDLNGQTRIMKVQDRSIAVEKIVHRKASGDHQIGAPIPGKLSTVLVKKGDSVQKGDPLFIIEAMKMETSVTAPTDGTISLIELGDGTLVDGGDLIVELS